MEYLPKTSILKKMAIIYATACIIDSFILRNIKKKLMYKNAVRYASDANLKLVVVGSPKLDLQTGGLISYATEKTLGPSYGCGDVCVDVQGCPGCDVEYIGDVLDFRLLV